jgi:hypothetical protein
VRGVQVSNCLFEGGFKFTKNFERGGKIFNFSIFLKTTSPPCDVINEQSLITGQF